MAYTYDNFTQAATKAGLLSGFSEDDLEIAKVNPEFGLSVLKLRQDAANATTEEQKLLVQEAENQLRSSFAANKTPLNYGGYTFEKQNAYQELLDKATNYEQFEFDPETDVRYKAYKKGYLREADRARENTLAKVSAATEGTPSSWAVNAADQSGNYYLGKLNDVIPTLYEDAFNEHMGEYNGMLNALAAMREERDFDYTAYLQERQNAMQLYNMGIQTPEIRKILGIPEPVAVSSSGHSGGSSSSGSSSKKTSSGSGGSQKNPGYSDLLEAAKGYVDNPVSSTGWKEIDKLLSSNVSAGNITQSQRNDIVNKVTNYRDDRNRSR